MNEHICEFPNTKPGDRIRTGTLPWNPDASNQPVTVVKVLHNDLDSLGSCVLIVEYAHPVHRAGNLPRNQTYLWIEDAHLEPRHSSHEVWA